MLTGLQARRIGVGDADIFARIGGSGPPLLMLHGRRLMIAGRALPPELAQHFTVVLADLTGYGESRGPPVAEDGANYSKRAVASHMVAATEALGFKRFSLAGHDRGARVAARPPLADASCGSGCVLAVTGGPTAGKRACHEARRLAGTRRRCQTPGQVTFSRWIEEGTMADASNKGRRDFLTLASVGGAAVLGGLVPGEARAAFAAGRSEKPLKAAFSNGGLQTTWGAQGKAAAEYWGKLFNVEVTWFDGRNDAARQRAAIEEMSSRKWDFVAIQAHVIDTLNEPVKKMIDAGIPVIAMDTLIAPLDKLSVYSVIAPDNVTMASAVTQALVTKLGGRGKMIMTQGPLGHTGAQGRTEGFNVVVNQYPGIEVLDSQPADFDAAKAARQWEGYLAKYPQIDAAFFHNDDMALAAYDVMKAHGRSSILIGGVDAIPAAIDAIFEGRMFATVRNPACLIHGAAIVAGVSAATAGAGKSGTGIPGRVFTDGPVVTLENARGMQWLQDQFLM
jgi:ribose transport system substrate-binding protein